VGNRDEVAVWDISHVSQCINLHGHLGDGAKDATAELQQLIAEAR